jgi:HEAT repeat protein
VHALTLLGWAPQTPEERALDLIAHGHYGQAIALGDVALDLLLSFIDHPLTATRREIAEAFGRLRSSKVLLALQKLVTDQDPAVRIAAVTSLARIQAPVGALEPLIRDPDKNVRIAAVEALGELKDTEAVPALTECLKDSQWDVRCAAALALGALGQRISVPLLADGLNDPDPDVRIACAEALGSIGDVEAIQPLIIAQLDPELSVRQAGSKAIARVDYRWPRNPRAYRTLALLKRAARLGDFAVQIAATELMERIFGIRRRALTMKSADADADRRALASEILISCLWDDNPMLRGAAAETLGLLRSRRAADVLRVMTEDDNAWVRGCATASLKRLDMADKAAAGGWQPSAGSNSAAA